MIPQKYPATEYGCHKEIDRLKEQLAKLQIEWGIEHIQAERIGLMYSPDEFMAIRRRAEMAESKVLDVQQLIGEWREDATKYTIHVPRRIMLEECSNTLEAILNDKKGAEEAKALRG